MTITAIITAAGSSTRMGAANKLLLPHPSGTLLGHVIQCVKQAGLESVVVLGHEHERVAKAIQPLKVASVLNPDYQTGMTSTIQTGVRHLATTAYLICLGDLPNLSSADITQVVQTYRNAADPKAIIIPTYDFKRGHPVLIGQAWRSAILGLPAGDGCKKLIKAQPENVIEVPLAGQGGIIDIDTPEAYQRFQAERDS